MIVGYKIQCKGLKGPMSVKGDTYDECMIKFRNYWEYDYDVDAYTITHVESIDIPFDIVD